MALTKKCSKCGEDKPLTDFYKDRKAPTGLCYRCKSCFKVFYRNYYARLKKLKVERMANVKHNPEYCQVCSENNKENKLMHKSWGTFCGVGHYKGIDF